MGRSGDGLDSSCQYISSWEFYNELLFLVEYITERRYVQSVLYDKISFIINLLSNFLIILIYIKIYISNNFKCYHNRTTSNIVRKSTSFSTLKKSGLTSKETIVNSVFSQGSVPISSTSEKSNMIPEMGAIFEVSSDILQDTYEIENDYTQMTSPEKFSSDITGSYFINQLIKKIDCWFCILYFY